MHKCDFCDKDQKKLTMKDLKRIRNLTEDEFYKLSDEEQINCIEQMQMFIKYIEYCKQGKSKELYFEVVT